MNPKGESGKNERESKDKIATSSKDRSQDRINVVHGENSPKTSSSRKSRRAEKAKWCWYDSECKRKECSFQHSFPDIRSGRGPNNRQRNHGYRDGTSIESKVPSHQPPSTQGSQVNLGDGVGGNVKHWLNLNFHSPKS